MTKNYNDIVIENEALVKAMLGESDIHYKFGYLESFVVNAMCEIPELKERVETRIASHIKLHALSNKAA